MASLLVAQPLCERHDLSRRKMASKPNMIVLLQKNICCGFFVVIQVSFRTREQYLIIKNKKNTQHMFTLYTAHVYTSQLSTVHYTAIHGTLHSCTPVFLVGLFLGLSTSPSPCSGPSCSTPVHYFIAQQDGSCPRLEGRAVPQSHSLTVS